MKKIFVLITVLFFIHFASAQNIGIGTTTPEAKLHVNGDLKLQNGFAINKFSRDSSFTENSHNNVPTEKAIKDYLQQGSWVAPAGTAGSQAPLARGLTSDWLNGPNAVYTSGSHCFVSSRNSNELVSFNISKPDSIYVRDRDATNLDGPVDVFVQGNYAYVVCEGNDRLCIFDVTNPAAMVPKGFISGTMRIPTSVFVQGNYAYVTTDFSNQLSVFDISDPNNIVAKGSTSVNMSLPTDVFVSGNFAYLVSSGNDRLCIYDISNPNAIVARGFTSTYLTDPRSVIVKNNFAYVTSYVNGRLCVLNVTNPDIITGTSFINTDLFHPTGLSITGNYAFVANMGYNSINLYDISNPASLRYIGLSQANLSGPYSVFAAGDFAYVGSYNNNRLCVFDLDKNHSIVTTPGGIQTAATQWQTGNDQTLYRSNGYVGIGTSAPAAKLQVSGSTIIDGNLGIGTTEASAPVQLASSTGEKIVLYGGTFSPHYGLGIQNGLLQMFTDAAVSDIAFGYGSSGSLTETMRILGNGNVGIGSASPSAFGHGGNSKILQVHNSNTFANSQSHLMLSSNASSSSYGSIGGLTFAVPNSAPADKRMGFIGSTFSATGGDLKFWTNNGVNLTQQLIITSNGNVGIGNTNPAKPLSFPATLGEKILLHPGGAGEVGIGVYGNELRLHADNPGASVSFGTQDNAGAFTQAGRFQLGGGYALYVNGSIWANGTTYASDERFKQNITAIQSPLQKLLQLNGVEYEMKTGEFLKNNFLPGRQIGLLAQNVEKILPEAVHEKDGYKGVDYAKLVPLLVEAIKEQQKQIETLTKQNLQQQLQIESTLKKLK